MKVFRKKFAGLVNSAIYVSTEKLWKQTFSFLTQTFCSSFRDFDWGIIELSDKIILSALSKTALNVSETIKWKLSLSKTYNCSTTSGLWMKNLLTSCWKTSANFSKLSLRVQVTFEGIFIKKCAKFLCPFSILIDLSSILPEFFREGFHSWVLCVRGSFPGKTFGVRIFFQIFQRFRIWGKSLGFLATTVRQCCQNCIPCASGKNWGNCCFEKICKL